MEKRKSEILKRIQILVEIGHSIKTQRYVKKPPSFSQAVRSMQGMKHTSSDAFEVMPHVENGPFEEWRTNALSLIESVTQPESLYMRNFEEKVKTADVNDVDRGLGILRALKNDIEQGYLTKFQTLVVAEVFEDFLEMATYLLEHEHKDLAAFLIGAVLEDCLRKMCRNNNIEVKNGDDISSLNQKLGNKSIYTRTIQKQEGYLRSILT